MTPLLIAVAGGFGAATRFAVDGAVNDQVRSRVPLGTVLVNVVGSFLLGLFTGWAAGRGAAADVLAVAGTGFLGGFTTFSAASVEAVLLVKDGRPLAAAGHAAGMLLLAVGAAAAGLWLGGR